MKTKQTFLILFFFMIGIHVFCQNYPNIVNYNFNGTPTYGVKIKTNLPFQNDMQMPTIKIEGYNLTPSSTINLNIAWYIHNNGFYAPTISSSGGTTPNVWLSNEEGKVIIFIDQKIYYQRFTISAFAKGMSEKPEHFQGWTVVDAALGGTNQQQVPYKNVFAGNVGIGTETPQEMLDVAGTIRAKRLNCYDLSGNTLKSVLARLEEGNNVGEGTYLGVKSYVSQKTPEYPDGKIKLFSIEHKFYGQLNSSIDFFRGGGILGGYIGINVHDGRQIGKFHIDGLDIAGTIKAREIKVEIDAGADHVFNKDYNLKPLSEVETFVKENKHLPEIPSEKQMQENGLNMNEFQIKLLQKIEELTLYTINQEKRLNEQQLVIEKQNKRIEQLENR